MLKTAQIPLTLWIVSMFIVSNSSPAAQLPGPHGGKVLKSGKVTIEFTIDNDEHPHIFRLDKKREAVALDGMKITLKALIQKKSVAISLTRTTEGLGTDTGEVEHLAGSSPMPGPDEYPVEITVRLGKSVKKIRFQFMEGFCAECGLPSFSCTCPETKEDPE